jgi:hypothetical protein
MYQNFIKSFLVVFTVAVLFHLMPLLIVDPMGVIGNKLYEKTFYIKEMRYQAASVINSVKFDGVVLGTSMAENFKLNELDSILGGSFINISVEGSLLRERKIILEYVLKKRNVSNVIMSLDGMTSRQLNQGVAEASWSYLYNAHRIDDLLLYSNRKYSKYINCHFDFKNLVVSKFFGNCPDFKIRSGLNNLVEWESSSVHQNKFGGLDKWVANFENPQVKSAIKKISDVRNNLGEEGVVYDALVFDENIIKVARENPDVEFHLFFPPYLVHYWAIERIVHEKGYKSYLEAVRQSVEMSSSLENVNVYWFMDQGFVREVNNYKDLTHYHGRYNSLFLESFKMEVSLLNQDNVKEKILAFENLVEGIDILSFSDSLNGLLEGQK